MYTNRFGTSFVSSGSTGGDQALKATIVAPKQQAQRSAMPAPILSLNAPCSTGLVVLELLLTRPPPIRSVLGLHHQADLVHAS